jgi:hypothetical protein
MPATKRRPSIRWLVIATVLSLMAFASVFFINHVEESSLLDIYVMLAETAAPLLTPILLVVLFVRVGPHGSPLQRNARVVCAMAVFAIPYYFVAGVTFSGNFEVYPSDTRIYAVLVGIAFLAAIVGFLPWAIGRSN